jgi:phage tail-like protein
MNTDFLSIFGRTSQEDPLKVFNYVVEIQGFARFGFSKCSAPQPTTEDIKYREGGQNATVLKSPGLTSFGDITLDRGQILAAGAGSKDILNWYQQVFDVRNKTSASSGTFRLDVDIVQFNKEGVEVLRWRLKNCWPKGMKPFSDLDALQSENSIEQMILVNEGFYLVS